MWFQSFFLRRSSWKFLFTIRRWSILLPEMNLFLSLERYCATEKRLGQGANVVVPTSCVNVDGVLRVRVRVKENILSHVLRCSFSESDRRRLQQFPISTTHHWDSKPFWTMMPMIVSWYFCFASFPILVRTTGNCFFFWDAKGDDRTSVVKCQVDWQPSVILIRCILQSTQTLPIGILASRCGDVRRQLDRRLASLQYFCRHT